MTIDLSAMRSTLIGHLRREKEPVRKENISAVVSLMKEREGAEDTSRIDQYLG